MELVVKRNILKHCFKNEKRKIPYYLEFTFYKWDKTSIVVSRLCMLGFFQPEVKHLTKHDKC